MCGFALAWVRRSRRWLWLGSGALLFSIGGSFKIGGHLLGMGGYSLAPPAWWLCNYIPPFSQVYTPLRAMPLVYLAMGAMATLLLSRRGVSASRLQILLIGAAITAESLIGFRGQIALPSTAHDVHPIYNKIKAVAGQAGVVDLPAPRTDNELGRYLLFQLTHRKRVPYNLDMDGFGATVSSEIKDLVMGLSMDAHFPNHPPDLELDLHRYRCRGGCGGVRNLRSRGYRFLILHRTGHQRLDQKFKTCLEHCVKDPFYSDGQLRAYDMAERSQKVLKKRAH